MIGLRRAAWVVSAGGLSVLMVSSAHAQEAGLEISVGHTIQQETNLFRLDVASDTTAERLDLTSVRVQYSKQFSLQQVAIDLALVDYDYSFYNSLDLLARNYSLEWRWALTAQWHGKVRAERLSTVNSFDNARNIEIGNQRLRRYEVLDATYELDGVWRLLMATQRLRTSFDQPQLGEDGSSVGSAEAGIRLDTSSGSGASLRWREERGRTLASSLLSLPVNNGDFDQSEWLMDLRWQATAKTRATMSIGLVDRNYRTVPERDFSGTNTSLAVDWAASAKTLWSARWSSDISGYTTEGSTYARTVRLGLTYVWAIGPRTRLQAGLNESRLSLGGAPAGLNPNTLRNATQEVSLGLRWAPHRNIVLETSIVDTQRRSNSPNQRFSNLLASGTATLSF